MEAVFSAQDGLETKSAEDKLSRSAKILFKHHSEKDHAKYVSKTNHGSLQISVEKEAVAEEASYLYVCRSTEEGHKAAGWKTLEQNTSTTCVTTFSNNQPLFGQGRWVKLLAFWRQ